MQTQRYRLTLALPFLLLCAACSTLDQPTQLPPVVQTKTVSVLPPKQSACPPLPAQFNTNGDLVNAVHVTWPQLYADCAAKVAQQNAWRAQHGGR